MVPPKPALPVIFSIIANVPPFILPAAQTIDFDGTPDSTLFHCHVESINKAPPSKYLQISSLCQQPTAIALAQPNPFLKIIGIASEMLPLILPTDPEVHSRHRCQNEPVKMKAGSRHCSARCLPMISHSQSARAPAETYKPLP